MKAKKAKLKDLLSSVGGRTGRYADELGCRTRALTRRVGPKRGGIALGVIATAVGLRYLLRFLKTRKAEAKREPDAWAPVYG